MDTTLDYFQGFTLWTPSRVARKTAVQRLCAAVVCHLRNREPDAAATDVRAMLAVAKCSTNEPLLVSQLVRFAMTAIALSATWELLQSPGTSEEQLAALQHDWEELEFAEAIVRSLEMERATEMKMADEMRKSGKVFEQVSASSSWSQGNSATDDDGTWSVKVWRFAKESWQKTRNRANYVTWRVAWANADQLTALKGLQASLECLRQARASGAYLPALQRQNREWISIGLIESSVNEGAEPLDGYAESDARKVLSRCVAVLDRAFSRVMVAEAGRRLVVTAIALKRFQLRHGSLPADLSALTPEILSTTPRDPVDGKPVRYRRNDDGTFLLYSIGENGVDDGGNPKPPNEQARARSWQVGRDWVWPQPATPEEIATYYTEIIQARQ